MKTALRRIGRHAAALAGIIALGLVAGCGTGGSTASPTTEPSTSSAGETSASSEPISVVASINQWGSLAKQIGGDYVDVTSILSSSNVEAHDFEAQGSDIAKLSKAQVVVANGAGYDTWATKSVTKQTALVTAAGNVGAADGDNPHLWFSKDARNAVAQDLADTFSKLRPDHRDYFDEQLSKWQTQEKALETAMGDFSTAHKGATYAATESVAYYLLADLGMKDVTPKGFAQAAANGSEPAPSDLTEMQKVLESQEASLLVNNPQESSDATNMITGVAHKSDVAVVDVTEQMPEDYATLTDWITALVKTFDETMDQVEQTKGTQDTPPDPGPRSSATASESPSSSSAQ